MQTAWVGNQPQRLSTKLDKNVHHTREELFDVVVLEQLLNTLGAAARVYQRMGSGYEHCCWQTSRWLWAGEKSDKSWNKDSRVVPKDTDSGVPAKDWPSGLPAQEKRKTEYLTPAVEETELPKAEKWTNKHELKCFNCGEKGHILRWYTSNAAFSVKQDDFQWAAWPVAECNREAFNW